MKYIITETKFENLVLNYLDQIFPTHDIHYLAPLEYDSTTGEEWEDNNRFEFYIGDYGDENTCFKWYDCEYFTKYSEARKYCPTVSIEPEFSYKLNSFFGEKWIPIFIKWFDENFDLPVKSVDAF